MLATANDGVGGQFAMTIPGYGTSEELIHGATGRRRR
jgi:hypothetical protein